MILNFNLKLFLFFNVPRQKLLNQNSKYVHSNSSSVYSKINIYNNLDSVIISCSINCSKKNIQLLYDIFKIFNKTISYN